MGTGSVALRLLRLFRVCRRCQSPFSTTRLQFEELLPDSAVSCEPYRWMAHVVAIFRVKRLPSTNHC